MEGLRLFIVGAMARPLDHPQGKLGPQPLALAPHIERHQPIGLPQTSSRGRLRRRSRAGAVAPWGRRAMARLIARSAPTAPGRRAGRAITRCSSPSPITGLA